jgi:hypothetical protein
MIVCVEQNGMQKSKPKSVIFYFADQKLTQKLTQKKKKMNKNYLSGIFAIDESICREQSMCSSLYINTSWSDLIISPVYALFIRINHLLAQIFIFNIQPDWFFSSNLDGK